MQIIHGFKLFNRKYLSRNFTTGCASNYVRQFGLHADECGVLRCKGKIGHASLSSDTVNPVLLSTHHHLTNLVIKEVHSKMMHGWSSVNVNRNTGQLLDLKRKRGCERFYSTLRCMYETWWQNLFRCLRH